MRYDGVAYISTGDCEKCQQRLDKGVGTVQRRDSNTSAHRGADCYRQTLKTKFVSQYPGLMRLFLLSKSAAPTFGWATSSRRWCGIVLVLVYPQTWQSMRESARPVSIVMLAGIYLEIATERALNFVARSTVAAKYFEQSKWYPSGSVHSRHTRNLSLHLWHTIRINYLVHSFGEKLSPTAASVQSLLDEPLMRALWSLEQSFGVAMEMHTDTSVEAPQSTHR